MKILIKIMLAVVLWSPSLSFGASATPVIPNVKMLVPISLNCTSGYLACTYTLGANQTAVSFVKTDATATNATINPPSGYTINGLSTYPLDIQGHTIMFILIGTTWYRF